MASILTALLLTKYSPDQPRDKDGKFGSGEGGDTGGFDRLQGFYQNGRLNYADKESIRDTYTKFSDAQKYSPSQKEVISNYADQDYKSMNALLRSGVPQDCETCDEMDSAFNKAKLPEDVAVYRGAVLSSSVEISPGSVLSDKGYVSTSMDPEIASEFAGKYETLDGIHQAVVFAISVPKGSRAIVPGPLGISVEKEIILPRNSRFQVTHVTEIRNFRGSVTKLIAAKYMGVEG